MSILAPDYGNFQESQNEAGLAKPASFTANKPADLSKLAQPGFDKLNAYVKKVQDEQDDARVLDALNDLKRRQIIEQYGDETTGAEGYSSLLGKNALQPNDRGEGLAEATDRSLREYGDELQKDMTARQREKFARYALGVYDLNFRSASSHVVTQGQEYRATTALGMASVGRDTLAKKAGDAVAAEIALADIKSGIEEYGRIKGLDKTAIEHMVLEQQSAGVVGAVGNLLDKADQANSLAYVHIAEKFVHDHASQMTGADLAKVDNAIRVTGDKYRIMSLVDAETQATTNDIVNGDLYGRSATLQTVAGREGKAQSLASAVETAGGSRNVAGSDALSDVRNNVLGDGSVNVGAYRLRVARGGEGGVNPENEPLYDAAIKANLMPGVESLDAFKKMGDKERGAAVAALMENLKDRVNGRTLSAKLFEGLLEKYKDESSAVAAYLFGGAVGDKVKAQGLNALSKKQLDEVQNVETILEDANAPKDSKGNKLSILDSDYWHARFSTQGRTAMEALADASRRDPRLLSDPQYQMQFLQRFSYKQALVLKNEESRQRDIVTKATQYIYEGHGDYHAIPPSLWAQLDLNQQIQIVKLAGNINGTTVRGTDQVLFGKMMSDEKYAELERMSPQEAKAVSMAFSDEDAKTFLRRWGSAVEKYGTSQDVAQGKVIQGERDKWSGATTFANTIPPDTIMGAVEDSFANDDLKNAFKKDTTGRKQAVLDAVKWRINDWIANGWLPAKPTRGQIAELVRKEKLVRGDVFGSYKGKALSELKASDLPDNGATDGRNVVRSLAYGLLAVQGQFGREPTPEEEEAAFQRLLYAPQTIPPAAFNGSNAPSTEVVLGENTMRRMDAIIRERGKANHLPEEKINALIARWRSAPRAEQVRTYVLATMNVRTGDESHGYTSMNISDNPNDITGNLGNGDGEW